MGEMRIGLLIYGSLDTVSGGYYYDRRLVASLQERGHAVQLFSIPRRNATAALIAALSFHLPPDLDLLIQDELTHPSLFSANRLPHAYPVISLVHHLRSSEDYPAAQKFFNRIIEASYLRSVDGFIFSSKTTQQAVHALIGDGRPSVIAYPPTDRFSPVLAEAGIAGRANQPGPLRILFVGNLVPRKGLSVLLTAISGLPANSVILNVVGSRQADPVYAKKITAQVAGLGLQASIEFHGFLDDESLQKQLEAAHVLVVPSSYEGFGIVYLEGMAFGLPAIGTTAGGACEIIQPGENGFLIQPGDAAALTVYLIALMTDRNLLAQLSLKALASYRQVPAWDQTVDSIHDFLLGRLA